MGQPLTVLRVEKLKSWGDVGGAGSHNLRHRDTPNAAPGRGAGRLAYRIDPES